MSDREKIMILAAICGGNLGQAREMAETFERYVEPEPEEPRRVAPTIYDHRKNNVLRVDGEGGRF